MNNQLSYCGLVDAKIRASDKDLSVQGPRTLELECLPQDHPGINLAWTDHNY